MSIDIQFWARVGSAQSNSVARAEQALAPRDTPSFYITTEFFNFRHFRPLLTLVTCYIKPNSVYVS
jgi:hypothetical protein